MDAPAHRNQGRFLRARSPTGQLLAEIFAFARSFAGFARGRAARAVLLVVLATLSEGLGLILLVPLLEISGETATPSRLTRAVSEGFELVGLTTAGGMLAGIVGLFVVAMIARGALLAWRQILLAEIESSYLIDRQKTVIGLLGRAGWGSIAGVRHSRILHLLGTEIYRVGQAAVGLVESCVAVMAIAVYAAISLYLDAALSLLAFVLLGVSALIARGLLQRARRLGEFTNDAHLSLLNDVTQFLGAMKLAMSQNLQTSFVSQFGRSLDRMLVAEIGFVAEQNRVRFVLTVLGTLTVAAIATFGVAYAKVPAAVLLTFIVIISRLSGPALQLHSHLLNLVRTLPAVRTLDGLVAELQARTIAADPSPLAFQDIRLEQVHYIHPGSDTPESRQAGIADVSLSIAKGGFIGLAGASGGGKTTLADLIVGLYAPQSGRILVGGAEVDLTERPAWRDHLSYVAQDAFLLNDTVKENLLWSYPGASAREIAEALEVSGAGEVVNRLPNGLETVVGERGALVSGGERQMIALARALIRRPRLLILDEATNAIDVGRESKILERLNALRPELTIILIAHRAESLRFCDEICILGEGRIVRRGSYASLREQLVAISKSDLEGSI